MTFNFNFGTFLAEPPADFLLVFLELTLDDLEALLKGVAVPLRPLWVLDDACGVCFFLPEPLEGAEVEAVVVLFLLDFGVGTGEGDLEAAREEVGVDKREREELGVSDRGSAWAEAAELPGGLLEPLATTCATGVSSSKSIRRCVFERRLELVRPVMILIEERNFASVDHCTS